MGGYVIRNSQTVQYARLHRLFCYSTALVCTHPLARREGPSRTPILIAASLGGDWKLGGGKAGQSLERRMP